MDRKPLSDPPYNCPNPGPELFLFGQSRARNHSLRRADISTNFHFARPPPPRLGDNKRPPSVQPRLTVQFAAVLKKNNS